MSLLVKLPPRMLCRRVRGRSHDDRQKCSLAYPDLLQRWAGPSAPHHSQTCSLMRRQRKERILVAALDSRRGETTKRFTFPGVATKERETGREPRTACGAQASDVRALSLFDRAKVLTALGYRRGEACTRQALVRAYTLLGEVARLPSVVEQLVAHVMEATGVSGRFRRIEQACKELNGTPSLSSDMVAWLVERTWGRHPAQHRGDHGVPGRLVYPRHRGSRLVHGHRHGEHLDVDNLLVAGLPERVAVTVGLCAPHAWKRIFDMTRHRHPPHSPETP